MVVRSSEMLRVRMRTIRRTVLLSWPLLLPAQPVSADSDGYFCVGPDYLAYQFGLAAPPTAPHTLYILRIGDGGGIAPPVEIRLPQFQVHGMRCRSGAIDILAFDSVHTVSFDEAGRSRGRTAVAKSEWEGSLDWSASTRNLAGLSAAANELRPERHELRIMQDGRRFVLEIDAVRDDAGSCATIITSRVVELAGESERRNEVVVYRGPGYYDWCSAGDATGVHEATRRWPSRSNAD